MVEEKIFMLDFYNWCNSNKYRKDAINITFFHKVAVNTQRDRIHCILRSSSLEANHERTLTHSLLMTRVLYYVRWLWLMMATGDVQWRVGSGTSDKLFVQNWVREIPPTAIRCRRPSKNISTNLDDKFLIG